MKGGGWVCLSCDTDALKSVEHYARIYCPQLFVEGGGGMKEFWRLCYERGLLVTDYSKTPRRS